MKNVWELFPTLTEAVRKDHEDKDCGHHPFKHALMVAQYCLIIAEDRSSGEFTSLAALLHNTDRLYPELTESEIERKVREYLAKPTNSFIFISDYGRDIIVDAVLNHHKKNDPNDSPYLVCLKDADRLANISPFDIIARSSRAFPNLPLVDPRFVTEMDLSSTYREPKTVFRDAIHSTLEWEKWLRLPKAKELARKYFEGLRLVQELTRLQLHETELEQYRP